MVQYAKLKEQQGVRIHLREEKVSKLRQTLASYLGHFKHANAYRLVRGLFEKYGYLKDVFALDAAGHLIPRYEPPFVPAGLRGQYKWAIGQYPGHCIFFQVGRFCEFYGEQAERYGKFFGLKPQPATRMNALQCGFPLRYLKEFKGRAFQEGLPYVVIAEQGYYSRGLKKRVITEILRRVA